MKRESRSAFAKQIKAIRYRLCLTQKEICAASDISLSNLKQWETDKSKPTPASYWNLRDDLNSLLARSSMSISTYEANELIKQLDIAYKNLKC